MSADAAATLLADVLGVTAADIPADASITTLGGWDSVSHLRLILAIEESIGQPLSTSELLKLTSVAAIADCLQRYSN